jgi:hypothetical protein
MDGTGDYHLSEIKQSQKDKYHMWTLDLKKEGLFFGKTGGGEERGEGV